MNDSMFPICSILSCAESSWMAVGWSHLRKMGFEVSPKINARQPYGSKRISGGFQSTYR
jgi:hypothetical protein